MSHTSLTTDRIKLIALQGLTGRPPAKAAGLSVFNGIQCPMRGHGRVRTLKGSHCADCVEAAATIKQKAHAAGRDGALKSARAQVAREHRAAERAKFKAEAAALRVQEKAARQKAARATIRATKRAERQATQALQAAPVEPVRVILCALEDDDDDRLPWE